VYQGTGNTQLAKIDNGKVYLGTGNTQVAAMKGGKIMQGTGNTQLGNIDGPHSIAQLAAVLHLVFALY
jgi:hypothetical protein